MVNVNSPVKIGDNNISDILTNIQKLQETETELINQLNTYTSTAGYVSTDPKLIEMVKHINRIADSRIAMFKTISSNANILQNSVSQSRTDLVSQLTLLQVVEDQLNQAKSKIDQLSQENDTKMRMVEVNTYYGQRYEAHSDLMKKIIIFCIPVLILFILKKKGILPELIATYLIGIVIAVGAFIILRNVWDIFTRSNMNFDTYNWIFQFNDTTKPPTIREYNNEHFFKHFDIAGLLENLMNNLGICVGGTCCGEQMAYDSTQMKCVVPPSVSIHSTKSGTTAGSTTKSGFTSNRGLKGAQYRAYFNDDINTYKGIAPYSFDMAYATV